MTAQQKKQDLINQFRNILMDEDTECGNEILCTLIAEKCMAVAAEFARMELERFREWAEDNYGEGYHDMIWGAWKYYYQIS